MHYSIFMTSGLGVSSIAPLGITLRAGDLGCNLCLIEAQCTCAGLNAGVQDPHTWVELKEPPSCLCCLRLACPALPCRICQNTISIPYTPAEGVVAYEERAE